MASEPNSAGHSFRVDPPSGEVPGDTRPSRRGLDPATVTSVVRIFKLLSDETRLRILYNLLEKAELNVRALCDELGQSQPAVSHHLALLKRAELIELRREGKHNYYSVRAERLDQLSQLIGNLLPVRRTPLATKSSSDH